MNQEIIALGIVAGVILYSLYKIVKSIRQKQKGACGDSICTGCSVKKEFKHLPAVQKHIEKIASGEVKMFAGSNMK